MKGQELYLNQDPKHIYLHTYNQLIFMYIVNFGDVIRSSAWNKKEGPIIQSMPFFIFFYFFIIRVFQVINISFLVIFAPLVNQKNKVHVYRS